MNTSMNQDRIAEDFSRQYGIPRYQILFLNDRLPNEPWFTAEALMAIARQSSEITEVSKRFAQFEPALNQVFHEATVVRRDGRIFRCTGVATLGERLPSSKEDIDEHGLAAARALRSALEAAGVNPTKPGSVVPFRPVATFEDDAESGDRTVRRNNDLARIHILAEQVGMIKEEDSRKDMKRYRSWLTEKYGVSSAAKLNERQRRSVINALEQKLVKRDHPRRATFPA